MIRSTAASSALLLLLVVAGCGVDVPEHPVSSATPIAVTVERVTESAWAAGLEVSATVLPLRRAMPGTVLMGRVEEVRYDVGDAVSSGAVLARVESREVSARLAQAEAGVAAARAMEQNALLMRQRLERLVARDAASKKSLDDAVAGHDATVAQVEAAEAAVEAARMYVSYSDIASPFDGVVVEKRVEVGDTAAPGMPLFVVEDLSRVKVEAQVPESTALALKPGNELDVDLPGAGPGPWRGNIDEVLPSADPRSRTFTVRVILNNAEGRLRSGMYGRFRLPGAESQVMTVPATAIVRRGPLAGVFVVGTDSVARLRWITLGAERDTRFLVLTGLAPGETFVVDPPADLRDGSRVEVS